VEDGGDGLEELLRDGLTHLDLEETPGEGDVAEHGDSGAPRGVDHPPRQAVAPLGDHLRDRILSTPRGRAVVAEGDREVGRVHDQDVGSAHLLEEAVLEDLPVHALALLRAEGIALLRAPVGDKYVLEEMLRGGHPLGGEQSGHIIFLERATTGDGILTGLLFAGLLQRTGLDLAAWASTVQPCPQVLRNIPVRERPSIEAHPVIGPAVRDEQHRLGDRGRVLVRYSGTEPKARVMVEGESRDEVESCAARLVSLIERTIGRTSS